MSPAGGHRHQDSVYEAKGQVSPMPTWVWIVIVVVVIVAVFGGSRYRR